MHCSGRARPESRAVNNKWCLGRGRDRIEPDDPFKNIAIAGGLLKAAAFGAGSLSRDTRRLRATNAGSPSPAMLNPTNHCLAFIDAVALMSFSVSNASTDD